MTHLSHVSSLSRMTWLIHTRHVSSVTAKRSLVLLDISIGRVIEQGRVQKKRLFVCGKGFFVSSTLPFFILRSMVQSSGRAPTSCVTIQYTITRSFALQDLCHYTLSFTLHDISHYTTFFMARPCAILMSKIRCSGRAATSRSSAPSPRAPMTWLIRMKLVSLRKLGVYWPITCASKF